MREEASAVVVKALVPVVSEAQLHLYASDDSVVKLDKLDPVTLNCM